MISKSDFVIQKVTSFTPQIAESLRHLAQQLGKNYHELHDEDIQEMIASPLHHLFVAKDTKTDTVAGMILAVVYRIPYVRKAYLDDLIVDASFRGHGLGTKLLQCALDLAKEKGAAYVDFTSRPSRDAGNSLYEKLGFKKRDTFVYRKVFDYGEV